MYTVKFVNWSDVKPAYGQHLKKGLRSYLNEP